MLRACPARRDNIISAGSAKPQCPCRRVGGSCYGGGRFEHLSTECLPFELDVDKWQKNSRMDGCLPNYTETPLMGMFTSPQNYKIIYVFFCPVDGVQRILLYFQNAGSS